MVINNHDAVMGIANVTWINPKPQCHLDKSITQCHLDKPQCHLDCCETECHLDYGKLQSRPGVTQCHLDKFKTPMSLG